MGPVDTVTAEVFNGTGTSDGPAVVLDDPNTEDELVIVGAGLEAGTDWGFPKAELSVEIPNMGLKL